MFFLVISHPSPIGAPPPGKVVSGGGLYEFFFVLKKGYMNLKFYFNSLHIVRLVMINTLDPIIMQIS